VTNRDCAILGFRLLGAWLIASGLIGAANIPYFFDAQFDQVRRMSIGFALLPSVVSAAVGGLAWLKSTALADDAFPDAGAAASDRLRADKVFSLALAIIGVLLVTEAIPVVVNGVALFGISRLGVRSVFGSTSYPQDQQALIWSAAAKANTAAGVARMLIGLALLVGPDRLARAVVRVRRELSGSFEEEGQAESLQVPPPGGGV
jgi:hypothetical protein